MNRMNSCFSVSYSKYYDDGSGESPELLDADELLTDLTLTSWFKHLTETCLCSTGIIEQLDNGSYRMIVSTDDGDNGCPTEYIQDGIETWLEFHVDNISRGTVTRLKKHLFAAGVVLKESL